MSARKIDPCQRYGNRVARKIQAAMRERENKIPPLLDGTETPERIEAATHFFSTRTAELIADVAAKAYFAGYQFAMKRQRGNR